MSSSMEQQAILECRRRSMTLKSAAQLLGLPDKTLHNRAKNLGIESWVSPPDAVDAEVVEAMRLLLLRLGHGWGVRKLVEPLRRMLPHRAVRVRHVRLAMQLLAPAQFAARAAPTYQRRLRGTFVLPHANLNWQLDLDCKLQDFGIYIAGVIDSHDRTVLALIVLFDKTARSTWSMLRIGLASTGHWPEMLSTDHAEELKLMAFAALEARQRAAGLGFATGFYVYPPFRAMDSKRHIRIERLWGDVNPKAVFAPKEMLLRMESLGILNMLNHVHAVAIQLLLQPLLQQGADDFVYVWNNAHVRSSKGHGGVPLQLRAARPHPHPRPPHREAARRGASRRVCE